MLKISQITLALIAAATLAACGGGSDTPVQQPTPAPAPAPAPSVAACVVNGTDITLAGGASCSYSVANINNGAAQTYTCSGPGGRITSNGISSGTITINGIRIACAP